MTTMTIDGQQLAVQDHGGDGPPVLLAHGFLMDHTMFDPQVEALRDRYRVITFDQRGFGETPVTGPFTYWDSAADALGILDALGIDQAVLGGMSQGGFLSLRAALTAPERVQALVLIDSQAGVEDPANLESYDTLHDVWMSQGPEPVQEAVASIILGEGEWHDWYAKWAALPRESFAYTYRCLMDRDDITDRIGEITCPTLLVHGTADAAIPIEKAEALRDGLGGPTTFVPIEGGSHASNLTHPEPVNQAIVEFLDSLDLG
ncbi:MAG: alpha/beta fold hydrolase [Acidimicrobiales bacterium]